jgi:hypothetical protein
MDCPSLPTEPVRGVCRGFTSNRSIDLRARERVRAAVARRAQGDGPSVGRRGWALSRTAATGAATHGAGRGVPGDRFDGDARDDPLRVVDVD